jgi:hypothetical protein
MTCKHIKDNIQPSVSLQLPIGGTGEILGTVAPQPNEICATLRA